MTDSQENVFQAWKLASLIALGILGFAVHDFSAGRIISGIGEAGACIGNLAIAAQLYQAAQKSYKKAAVDESE